MARTRIPLPSWEKRGDSQNDRLQMSTAEIGLDVRTVNCLEEHGVLTVEQLLQCSPQRLLSFPNFGQKTLDRVYDALEALGFPRQAQPTAELAATPTESLG